MAKKNQKLEPLSLQDIILRGDAETIRQALEARIQIDTLLEEREAAYRRISELEEQVEDIVGEEGVFPFPEPPIPVASFDVKAIAPKKKKPAAPKPVESAPAEVAPATETPATEVESQIEAAAPEAETDTSEESEEASK